MALFEYKVHPTQWHEGMLLGAQHFQHADFYHHTFVHQHMQAAGAYHWGIYHLSIDPAQLVGGVYRVLSCQAFMPDGTIVQYGEDDGYDLTLSFADQGEVLTYKPLKIYLAVPKYRPNVGYQSADVPRYRSVMNTQRVDLNTGEDPLDIPVLVPQCLLLTEDQVTHQYVTFPLAEIGVQDDVYKVTSFNPPCVKVMYETSLGHTCLEILAHLKEKLLLLSDRVQSAAGRSEAIVETLSEQFRMLMPSIPPFEALLYSQQAHPFQLYISLTHIVGHLMALKPGQRMLELPLYDHHQLDQVFKNIFALVQKYTEDLGNRFKKVIFQKDAQGFSLAMNAERIIGNQLIVAVRWGSNMTEQDAARWMSGAIIASGHALSHAKDRRVLGASRKLMIEVNDTLIVQPVGSILYQIDLDPFFIQPQGELRMMNPSEPQSPAEISLMLREEAFA